MSEYKVVSPISEGERTIESISIETDDGKIVRYSDLRRRENRVHGTMLVFGTRTVSDGGDGGEY